MNILPVFLVVQPGYKTPGYNRNTDIREIFSGPKLEPVLPKQDKPNPDIRDLFSSPDNSLISGFHCNR